MNDEELLLTSLSALRNQLLATASVIEIVLESASRPSVDTSKETGAKPCRHPLAKRMPTPSMGHLHRFRCRDCNQEVEE